MNPLVSAWQDAIDSFQQTVAMVPDGDFAKPSLLPGWTVGDIVAHVCALEVELSGEALPAYEPDWESLPHANDLFSRYTEIGVDYRRGRRPERLRAELSEVTALRSEQLTHGPQDDDHEVPGPAGIPRSFSRLLRMRCFDIFLHELDVRDALDLGEPRLGPAATVTVGLMADSLGYVWVKKAGAEPGQVLHFAVPDYVDAWIGVGEDGRGRVVAATQATTTVTLEPLAYIRLASGRRPDPSEAVVDGDRQIADKVLLGLNVAP